MPRSSHLVEYFLTAVVGAGLIYLFVVPVISAVAASINHSAAVIADPSLAK